MEILKVDHITKCYGNGENEVKAVSNVSFTIEKGQFVAIIGPSGSGKSTLMHMMGGVDRPTSGSVLVEGVNIFGLTDNKLAVFRRRQIGLIYQFYNLIPVLTVEENLSLPMRLDGRRVDPVYLEEMIHMLGLNDRRSHLPNQLSGGQQQRVSIGRALLTHPALILADEPTGNLDSANSQEIMRLLMESNKKYHQTIVMITHDESIALMADRILSIEDGKIAKDEILRPIGR